MSLLINQPQYWNEARVSERFLISKTHVWLQPYGSCLIHWEIRVIFIRRVWKRTWCRSQWIWIVQDSNPSSLGPCRGIHETWTGNNVIITASILIHCDQEWVWLTNMNIHICVVLLYCVWSFSLHKEQVVVLDSEIQASRYTNVVYAYSVSFACYMMRMHTWS